jgi:hypothetical protein
MKLHSSYVSVFDFDDQYFEVSFDTQDPDDEIDLSAPLQPYLLIQRQFERLLHRNTRPRYLRRPLQTPPRSSLPRGLAFEIDRPNDRIVEVTYTLDATRFREMQRIVHIIFGVQGCAN